MLTFNTLGSSFINAVATQQDALRYPAETLFAISPVLVFQSVRHKWEEELVSIWAAHGAFGGVHFTQDVTAEALDVLSMMQDQSDLEIAKMCAVAAWYTHRQEEITIRNCMLERWRIAEIIIPDAVITLPNKFRMAVTYAKQ